jgi:hypothetical protein
MKPQHGATYASGGNDRMHKQQAAGPAKGGHSGKVQTPAPGKRAAAGGPRTTGHSASKSASPGRTAPPTKGRYGKFHPRFFEGGSVPDTRPRTGRRSYAKGGRVVEENTHPPEEFFDREHGAVDVGRGRKVFGEKGELFDTPDRNTLMPETLDIPITEQDI